MFTDQDKQQIEGRGMTLGQVEKQLHQFVTGFPYLKLQSAASTQNGIFVASENDVKHFVDLWENYKKELLLLKKVQ